jgi:hypothetical protein
MRSVQENFAGGIDPSWHRHLVGRGSLELGPKTLHFVVNGANSRRYSNAQLDDYQHLSRRHFLWRPPLRLTVQARFSHSAEQLQGTAGFGFWNDPFLMTGPRLPTLPRAAWFFYSSPPSNMKLDSKTPGYGWKAATIDALRPLALLWAPTVPLAVPLMNLPSIYRRLWPPIQQTLKIHETILDVDMTQWHVYILEWGVKSSRFSLAEEEHLSPKPVLDTQSPKGPLGFVMWLDNQYLVVTPWGRLHWGLLDVPCRQWMEVASVAIEPLGDSEHG